MYGLKVRIRTVIEPTDPISVECVMTDYEGQTHYFREKLPNVSTELSPMIPGDGVIRCSVLHETNKYAEIDTSLPDGVESTMGISRFKVHIQDLTDTV